jgi:oligopeptide/dipeptide ABC transporter ATP-binding protein
MRQRVMIGMALSCDPKLIIADEPTTALDVTVQAQILALFGELQERLGTALVFVTHDVSVAAQIADEIAVMYAGSIVEHGPAAQVLAAPRHPYTAALLDALPTVGTARGALRTIPGSPPVAGQEFPGCAFAERCARAEPGCAERAPALRVVALDHRAACPVVNPDGGSPAAPDAPAEDEES